MARTAFGIAALSSLFVLACSGTNITSGAAGATGTGGTSGGSCTTDADCAPAQCGSCPDGTHVCPPTRCRSGTCFSDPAPCTQCQSDADCPAPACSVCTDGSLACITQHCSNGTCGSGSGAVCASRSGPACQTVGDCSAPACANCPNGANVCSSADCTDGMCHSGPASCPQCAADADCGKPQCNVCWNGSTVCSTPSCRNGQCANSAPQCPERPTGAPLTWHWTCGDPVCQVPDADAGVPDAGAPCAAAGTPCSQRGAMCGNGAANCGAVLICEDYDPTIGGCPISSAKFKNDIRYLGDADLERLRDEVEHIRLATYEYKPQFTDDPTGKHLGFIIEDAPQSPAVDRGHDRVDLYGYVSMVVASMQVQQKEIEALRHEVKTLRAASHQCATKRR